MIQQSGDNSYLNSVSGANVSVETMFESNLLPRWFGLS